MAAAADPRSSVTRMIRPPRAATSCMLDTVFSKMPSHGAITTTGPESGRRDLDTLHVIKAYRGVRDADAIDFGIYGEVVEPGPVRVGDPVGPVA